MAEVDPAAFEAFTWLGILAEDATVAAPMASTLWNKDQEETFEILEVLWTESLLLAGSPARIGGREWPTYRVHDLLHDFARRLLIAPESPKRPDDLSGLGLTLPEAHRNLLDRYRLLGMDGMWHTIPNDGYILVQSAWHMEQAKREDDLHSLLSEETSQGRNGWFQARDSEGQITGYMADVARALRLVTGEGNVPQTPKRISLQVHYHLIMASVNSLAGTVPPLLLKALVEYGLWIPAQGLGYAQRNPDSAQRLEALTLLLPYLTEAAVLGRVRTDALDQVRAIDWSGSRASALDKALTVPGRNRPTRGPEHHRDNRP